MPRHNATSKSTSSGPSKSKSTSSGPSKSKSTSSGSNNNSSRDCSFWGGMQAAGKGCAKGAVIGGAATAAGGGTAVAGAGAGCLLGALDASVDHAINCTPH